MRATISMALAAAMLAGGCMNRTLLVSFDENVRGSPATGRLVVYFLPEGSPSDDPAAKLYFEEPRPVFGIDVEALAPDEDAVVEKHASSFPVPIVNLESGRYKVRAVLDLSHTSTRWQLEPGNLYSDVVAIDLRKASTIHPIELTHTVAARSLPARDDLGEIVVPSSLLSTFRRGETMMRAAVVFPRGYDQSRDYPAIYVVPAFGADHFEAVEWAERRALAPSDSDEGRLAGAAFIIVLDPNGPLGHHYFADSANNGPVARALVEELIPALEARFNLIPEPGARLLHGHGAGGWSAVWLGVTEPDTFGAAWATAPDPLDFRALRDLDIYDDLNAFLWEYIEIDPFTHEICYYEAEPVPARRRDARVVSELRDESRTEEVLGPFNTSAGQWDSMLAAFGPRNEAGYPEDLWNRRNGYMNLFIAREFEFYDVSARARREPDAIGRLLRERVRIVVGSRDDFYLDQPATLLASTLAALPGHDDDDGYVEIIPGENHESIRRSDAARRFAPEMLDHLRRHHYAP